jgi:ribonuclease BN (tRNA processing enzyme)
MMPIMDGAPSLTVIGCSPAWGNPGEPCSSYLVEAGGARILLDCGSGAFAALLALDPAPLDAVVLSHMHHDHVADLIPFGYARRYARLREWPAPRLFAPPGGLERLAALASAGGGAPGHLDGPFVLSEYLPGAPVEVGGARLTFAGLRHPGVSHAIRVEAAGRALCFSGDTGPTPALGAHARGVGLLLCEATYAADADSDDVHLSASDAGQAATEADAARLVLVHVDAHKRPQAVAAARTTFAGPVDAAVPGYRRTT